MASRSSSTKASPVKRRMLESPPHAQEAKTCRLIDSSEEEETEQPASRGSLTSLGSLRSSCSHTFALSSCNTPPTLLGRETERASIEEFLQEHVQSRSAGSMYIAGKPGTGKTATVEEILRTLDPATKRKLCVAQVNCMRLKDPRGVFAMILSSLRDVDVRVTAERAQAELFEELSCSSKTVVLVLDEIDQLMSQKDGEVLYTLFELPTRLRNVLVIGIANAVDLTERQLPMLELLGAKGLRPTTLIFRAYTRDQLVAILKQRLAACDDPKVLADAAVTLCASKVTAASGDVRIALDLCRRVIDKAARSPLNHLKLMLDTCEEVFASGTRSRVESLTVHQRIMLLAICKLDGYNKDVVLGKVYETYHMLCRRVGLPPMGEHDLNAAFEVVRCVGVLRTDADAASARARKTEKRDIKVKLTVHPDEVNKACSDSVFKTLLAESAS
eukprot:m.76749 g.76749  ORF g.76749 m.76749 type:complete len:444 (+) comp13191_c0_seq1:377-1708(+)